MYNITNSIGNFNITYVESLEGTKYMQLAVEAWADLLKQKYCGNGIQITNRSSGLILEDLKRHLPVGIIIFTRNGREINLDIGYIKFLYRGKGLYTKLWNNLVITAKKLKVNTITSDAFIVNKHIHTIYAHQGRKPYCTVYKYEVE